MRKTRIDIRVTPEEKEIIRERAKEFNMTITDYILYNSLRKKPIRFIKGALILEQFKDLNYEINQIGTNINQAVRVLNTKKERFSDNQVEDLIAFHDEVSSFSKKSGDLLIQFLSDDF